MDVWQALLKFIFVLAGTSAGQKGKRQQGRDMEGQHRSNLSQVETTTLGPSWVQIGSSKSTEDILEAILICVCVLH